MIYSRGGSVLIAGKKSAWLVGGVGRNKYKGGAGNDTLIISTDDAIEDIDCGSGFNSIFIEGDSGRYFTLAETKASLVKGTVLEILLTEEM